MGGEGLSNLYTPEFQKQLASLSDEEFNQVTQPLRDLANTGNIANTILLAKGAKDAEIGKNTITKGSDTIKSVVDDSGRYPKQIVAKLTDTITPIDAQTRNILDTTSIEKFNNYVKTGEKALKDPRELTPLEQAGEKVHNQILPNIKEDLNRIGAQKSKSLESVKNVQVPNATVEATNFIKDAVKTSKLTVEETKLVKEMLSQLELGKSPTLGTLDKTVDLETVLSFVS